MSHLIAAPAALTAGAVVGVGAGLYAYRTADHAIQERSEPIIDDDQPGEPSAYLIVGLGAVAGLLIGARFGMSAPLPAYLYLVAIAPALGVIDAFTRRLPDRIVLPSYPIAAALLGLAAWRDSDVGAFERSLLAGAAVYAFLLLIALAAPARSFGWADVKLGGLLGLFLGYPGWLTAWVGMMIAFALASAYVITRALVQRGHRARVVPLGPALLLGTLLAVVAS